ncbi:MAG: DEAD/DEAH box helicase family protein [Solirubrobacterales bacterium]
MADEPFDLDRIAAVAARLELRDPNREALESIAFEVARHFEIEERPPPFRGVVDAATGVGKTYILAAAIEYFAAQGTRNFAVITPGRTILEKTEANFTPGHPKTLLRGMEVEPVVITSENFATAAMRSAMEDPEQVKLYVFTVQSLTKPGTKQGRKTRDFNESLGEAFYEALQSANDLIVFADEHHTYFGPKFSDAVADLHPRVLLGLTATPHPKTPADEIIFRYPLAAAIADKLVKTPVIVGRKDDRSDPMTKLHDGIELLRLKERAVAAYCDAEGEPRVNPIMLVIAKDIDEANELESILKEPDFAEGEFGDKVLTVHSKKPDEALAALDKLEDPGSPYRIVISVGMLKEGWDNKSVYVIASMRASVSTILTEQTLGRGLRLPFGEYTDIEVLDTLEVLGHESYKKLLEKAGVINEAFIDRRTRAVLRKNAEGELVPTLETTEAGSPVETGGEGSPALSPGKPGISTVEGYTEKAEEELEQLQEQLSPRPALPRLQIPILKMSVPKSSFSLADITDMDPFEKAGKRIAVDPESELRRTTVSAKIVEGPDGLRHTELITAEAVDKVKSAASLIPLEDARRQLLDRILASSIAPARAGEGKAAAPLVDAFVAGLGDKADELLSAYMDRAAARLISLIGQEHRHFVAKPKYRQVVEIVEFNKTRTAKPKTTENIAGKYQRGTGYRYKKSLYTQDWFDSSTERDAANILDDSKQVEYWLRLQTGDLPILWAEGRDYNPDFIVVEGSGPHYVLEIKMDKERASLDVKGKKEAARRWANHVNKSAKVQVKWAYLLAFEEDVKQAAGSWPALKKLAS